MSALAQPQQPTTPSWFIADSQMNTVAQRESQIEHARQVDEGVETLRSLLPDVDEATLRARLTIGKNVSEVASQLLEEAENAGNDHNAGVCADENVTRAPEQMRRCQDVEGLSRVFERVRPRNASAAEPSAGGSSASSADIEREAARVVAEQALKQTRTQLAHGMLRIQARIASTQNAIEETMLGSEKIYTKFIIQVEQLGIKWEVSRRYSEFSRLHEALTLTSLELPELPPKILFSQESDDIADRMFKLSAYLSKLVDNPQIALAGPVCAFLDAVDAEAFRSQLRAGARPFVHRFVRVDESAAPSTN